MDEKLMQAETASAETASEKKKKLPGIGGKRKKRWLFLLAAVVLAAALLGSQVLKLGKGGTVRDSGYQAAAVLQRDLSVTVTGTATLVPKPLWPGPISPWSRPN